MSNIGRLYDVEYESYDDLFDIASTKSVPVERLMKWRQAALVLNASRRFRYTLDLKKEEEKKRILAQIRVHAQNIRAAYLFASGSYPTASLSPIPIGDYGISPEQLTKMTKDNNFFALRIFGGVKGLAEMLKTNLDKGIHEDNSNILDRKNVFGSNTYPRKKGQGIWRFMLDASRDITLIILMVAAAASLALGIKTHGIKEGWYDGGSIALAVIIVILVTAISDYKQSLQFQNLNEEKQNIQLEVVRGGRRVEISIYDIVVGDVIPLNIGDQVPADGVLISGHSLAIDESNMTGESRIVHKDHKSPFLMSGCMVADGYGTMLATSVGINTEWGSLMSSISEDNSEETPLQVRLNGVATFIGIGALMVAVFVLIILLARFFTGHTKDEDGKVEFVAGETNVGDAVDGVFKIFIKVVTFVGDAADGVIKIFTVVVTIVVVTVPEGIPLAITLTLAYSMRKMMADKALVRRLSTCEIMGSATTICSDKTGTLTLNLMTVVEAYICGKKINLPNNLSELPSGATPLITNIMWRNLLVQALYQVSVLLVLYFRGREILHSEHDPYKHATKEKNTLIFNAFVFSQIFNEFNARKPDEINVFKGVTKNRLFMGIVGFTVVLQVVLVMFLGKFTSTVRLSWQLWLVSIAIALISWPLAVVGKLIPVPGRPFRDYFVDMFGFCIRRRNRGLPASRLLAVVAKSIPIAVIILFTCLHFVHS